MEPQYVLAPFDGKLEAVEVINHDDAHYRVVKVNECIFQEIDRVACGACVRLLDADQNCATCSSKFHFHGSQVFPKTRVETVAKNQCQPCRVFKLGFQRSLFKSPKLSAVYNLDCDQNDSTCIVYALHETVFARAVCPKVFQDPVVVEYCLVRPPNEQEPSVGANLVYHTENGIGKVCYKGIHPSVRVPPAVLREAVAHMPWVPR